MIKVKINTLGKLIKYKDNIILRTPTSIYINDNELNSFEHYLMVNNIKDYKIFKDIEEPLKKKIKCKKTLHHVDTGNKLGNISLNIK